MTRDEALEVLAGAATSRLCVSYVHDSEGNIRFAPAERRAWKQEIHAEFMVPARQLTRMRRAAMTLVAASIPLSLTACAGSGGVSPSGTTTSERGASTTTVEIGASQSGKAHVFAAPPVSKLTPVTTDPRNGNVNPVEPPDEPELMMMKGDYAPPPVQVTPPQPPPSRTTP